MKKLLLCVLAVLMIASVAVRSETWIRTYGSGLENQGHDVLLLEDGGYLIVGDTVTQYEPVLIGHLLLLRLGADGEVVWERTYGGDRSCTGQSTLAAEDGGYVIAGTIESAAGSDLDVYLLRVDEDGTELWSRTFGTPLDEVGGRLLGTADGGYVVVGNSVDRNDVVADPGAAGYAGFAGRSDAYIVRTDEAGNEIWSRRYDTEDNVIASGGAIAADGGIVVLTYVLHYPIDDNNVRLFKVDATGAELWSRTWEEGKASGYDMIATSDGGYLISGMQTFPDDPERAKADALLIKVNGDGCELWTATYGEADQVETAHAVTKTSDGQYVSAGSRLPDLYTYRDDIYLVGFDANGSLLWESVTPTVKHNMHEALVQHPDGSFVIVGSAARPGQSFRIQLIKEDPPRSVSSSEGTVDAREPSDETDPFSRPVSTAEAEGMDPELLNAMMDSIRAQNARTDSVDTIDSVIVIRHGNVVLEEYPNPSYSADQRHHLFSVTKSITSLLVGVALDRGLIESVDVPILDLFPGLLPEDEVQSKSAITLEHLLTMTAGLEWDEDTWPTRDPRNDFGRLEVSREPVQYVLGKPQVAPPGELLWYNSGLSHVLSAVIAEVSGMTTLQFAQQALFDPLGFEDVYWRPDGTGLHKGGTQLYLRPRDLAKIGVLCLNDGRWNGAQIVSEAWLEESARTRIHGRPDYFAGRGYAYHWWTLDECGVYYASGSQGQNLYVFPDLELVVVFTATVLEGDVFPEALTRDYLLPAVGTAP